MSINFDKNIFKLDTLNTTYLIGLADNYVGHVYYGSYIKNYDASYLLRVGESPFVPSVNKREKTSFLDSFPMEYSTGGVGDFRESCLNVRDSKGYRGCEIKYLSHNIIKGKSALKGLPSSFGSDNEVDTLEIICTDSVLNLDVILVYSVFEKADVITRSVKIINKGTENVFLEKVYSACLDMDNENYDMLILHGSWARERNIQRNKVHYGKQSVSSLKGSSSHQEHPFIALMSNDANYSQGHVYAMNFVYSGNFLAQAELNQFDSVRMTMGIHHESFEWKLEPNEEFQAPEVVLVFSENGLDTMTHRFHDFYRKHLIRSKFKDKSRPVLINNWEATYFDFNTEKLIDIAKSAKESGIEMLVMDDGWFGNRSSDDSSLGDWFVNEDKINGGLEYLVSEVNKIGLEFGIWFEPEMISPNSELFRKHPDWAIQIPNREASECRAQYVLDFSRKEIIDYIYNLISNILKSAPISYVKWDMNRQLTDIGSIFLDGESQGELFHRYVLGVYEIQQRLVDDFPDLLLENCSGGGARFDPGMLYYSPQIWCSDDTDAVERIKIQEGTALIYPLSTIGAHVSDCPNHTVGRITPFKTRGDIALFGTFGYELDITKIPKEDRDLIPEQIKLYHKYNKLVREGDYYRLGFGCWQVVSKDKTESLICYVQVMARPNFRSQKIKLKGLSKDFVYKLDDSEKIYYGDILMNAGLILDKLWGDFQSKLYYFKKI